MERRGQEWRVCASGMTGKILLKASLRALCEGYEFFRDASWWKVYELLKMLHVGCKEMIIVM